MSRLISLGQLPEVFVCSTKAALVAVRGLALFKGQLIGDYFMGLKGIRGPWCWVISLWLLLVGALIASAFMLSSGASG